MIYERVEITVEDTKNLMQFIDPKLTTQLLHDYEFAKRCARDGILTYSRECEEGKQIIKRLDAIIKEIDIDIQKEENCGYCGLNLKQQSEKKLLQRIKDG